MGTDVTVKVRAREGRVELSPVPETLNYEEARALATLLGVCASCAETGLELDGFDVAGEIRDRRLGDTLCKMGAHIREAVETWPEGMSKEPIARVLRFWLDHIERAS